MNHLCRTIGGVLLLLLGIVLGACTTTPAPAPEAFTPGAAVLLYSGAGADPSDVRALEQILGSLGLTYTAADAGLMNALTESDLQSFKLILWPGGRADFMGAALTPAAVVLVRKAVVGDGVPYLGFCAGAYMASKSHRFNSFNLTGVHFDEYEDDLKGTMKEMVKITFPDPVTPKTRDLVYWDGYDADIAFTKVLIGAALQKAPLPSF